MSDLVREFLIEYKKSSEPFLPLTKDEDHKYLTTESDLVNMLAEVEIILKKNKDASREELVNEIVKDIVPLFEDIRLKYGVPGWTTSIRIGSTNVKLYGGNINAAGDPMPENALFDIASMTKFYTEVVAYKLIGEGYFKRSDIIKDLDDRFVNLDNVTVDDLLTFSVKLFTDGLIRDKGSKNEALDTLYKVKATEFNDYFYIDQGLMVMKEVMEKLTGLSYPELVDKYIVEPLELKDTHIIVPKNKFHLLTGSPNAHLGHINDMSANALGGYSGHAGVHASSDDVAKMMLGVRNKLIIPNSQDMYLPNKNVDSRAVMGSVYRRHNDGLYEGFIDNAEAKDSFGISGSTRTNAAADSTSAYTALFNPSSMNIEEAKERLAKINEERIIKGLKPFNSIGRFKYTNNGVDEVYDLIDPRQIFPVEPMALAVQKVAHTTLKLKFLEFVLKKYEKELETIDVVKNAR